MRRADCPECGERHVIDEAATETTCPVTGARLEITGGILVVPTTPPPPAPAGHPPPVPEVPLEEKAEPPVRRSLLIAAVAIALVAIIVVVVLLVVRSGDDQGAAGTSVRAVVVQQLDASQEGAQTACQAVRSFGKDRKTLVQMLDQMPAQAQSNLVDTMRTQGGSWLPPESADWGFPELRRALVTLWDECGRRGL
jgi:hypothetical protein